MNAADQAVVRELYPVGGVNAVLRRCPHLSEAAIRGVAWRAGISRNGVRRKGPPPPPNEASRLLHDFTNRKCVVRLRKWSGPVSAGPLVATIVPEVA